MPYMIALKWVAACSSHRLKDKPKSPGWNPKSLFNLHSLTGVEDYPFLLCLCWNALLKLISTEPAQFNGDLCTEAGLAFRSLLGSLLYCYHSGHLYIQRKMAFWLKINFGKGISVFVSNVWGFVNNKDPAKNPQPNTAVRQWKTELCVCKPSCFRPWKGKYIQQVKHSTVIRAATSRLGDGNSQPQSWSIYSAWQQRMCCRYTHDWDHSEQL